MADSSTFSLRIVSLDYYMASPIPDLDISYSSFHGGRVNEVPVIRIFGSTPAGQKTCLHIHRILPYLYVPCADIPIQSQNEGDAYTHKISLAIEKALQLKSKASSKRQHVHGCSLVRGKRFYGYHPTEELFVKIYLYYPHDVSRTANILLGGGVLGKCLQPHESHIPFILQFLVDSNLHGMGHVHLSKVQFRHPIPDHFCRSKFVWTGQSGQESIPFANGDPNSQADTSGNSSYDPPIWISSTVPADWMWYPPAEFDGLSPNPGINSVKRQSLCHLEGDSTADEILNKQSKTYQSLSQTPSEVKMVQSLAPIWEEEYERTGVQEIKAPSNPSKPPPEDVLKTLSLDPGVFIRFIELRNQSESSFSLTPTEKDVVAQDHVHNNDSQESLGGLNETGIIGSLQPRGKDDFISSTERAVDVQLACSNEHGTYQVIERLDEKAADKEALGLIKWLTSSQAVDDINSDDELLCEAVLSPFLPANTIEEVLQRANMDYESESQKECQEILDSIQDFVGSKDILERDDIPANENSPGTSYQNIIPQVDGAGDDISVTPDGSIETPSDVEHNKIDDTCENPMPKDSVTEIKDGEDAHSKFSHNHKRKKMLWGSLPFCANQNFNNEQERKGPTSPGPLCGSKVSRHENSSIKSLKETTPLVECSVRDLMRKKRKYRVESVECDSQGVEKIPFEMKQKEDIKISPKHLDFLNFPVDEPDKRLNRTSPDSMLPEAYDFDSTDVDSQFDEKVTVLSRSESSLRGGSTDDGNICSRGNDFGDTNIGNFIASGFSGTHVRPSLPDSRNPGSEATFSHCKREKEGDVQFLRPEDKTASDGVLEWHGQGKGIEVLDRTLLQTFSICVPSISQNDGSYLYLLSPRVSPPTAENVKGWLSTVTSIDDNKVSTKSSAQKGTSRSSPGDYNKVAPESDSICHPRHIQPPGDSAHVKAYSDWSQDISQISGPEGKSKPTPLSQTGFRDPASVGGGQQLSLLSIEIQAASSGDLRPDPRFDAISIITLAVQNDNDCNVEVYVLLHSKAEDSQRNLDGISGCNVLMCCEEKHLFDQFIKFIRWLDPDILMGWDVQGSSLGFLAERASHLGIGLLNIISRIPLETKMSGGDDEIPGKGLENKLPNSVGDPVTLEDAIISDEWGRTHASGVHVGGRIVLNVWRLMRGELNLNMYTVEAVADAVLRRKIPYIPYKVLTRWFSSGPERARYRCIEYVKDRAKLNLELLTQLDMISRTSELARVFGIDFFSVLSRGSQYRVESMYLRLAHTQNYLAISPGNNQVASQPAMECQPLVMEPESGFYSDPVVVLDFQSLYPSMIIAYNLCYSTCLGSVVPKKENVLGVTTFSPDPHLLQELKDKILVTPNGVMYVPSKVRQGVLPRLLEEILSTRIMVKQAMKKLTPSQLVLHRIFNARQLALKLIANVTYGYTAAGFSGRMPCAELADSIVQCGRRTLETAISFVNSQEKWSAKVIYGDTDSMFVHLEGRTVEDAFRIGNEIASEITAMNPNPVVLKMEKVYHPCFLLTKKRYVGYSYESPKQEEPVFDAKGIETVRRDTCRAVSKTMEQSLRLFFEDQDISELKNYLERQWKRILSGRVSLQDFVFAKEVRLGTYSSRDSSSLPPAAIVATKAMRADPRAEPRYGDRIPYVVVHGEPGARLIDMVVDPLELLAIDSPYRLNDIYYITKQIIPALQRLYGLVGADLNKWFLEMPRMIRDSYAKRPMFSSNPQRTRIDYYYLSKHCVLCSELVEASAHLCRQCSQNETGAVTAVVGRTSKLEREMQHLAAICRHCGGGDWIMQSGVKCVSLACPVFYERCKVQKELQGLAAVAADKDLYPKCMVEWF